MTVQQMLENAFKVLAEQKFGSNNGDAQGAMASDSKS